MDDIAAAFKLNPNRLRASQSYLFLKENIRVFLRIQECKTRSRLASRSNKMKTISYSRAVSGHWASFSATIPLRASANADGTPSGDEEGSSDWAARLLTEREDGSLVDRKIVLFLIGG
jgi:hypothetical protein